MISIKILPKKYIKKYWKELLIPEYCYRIIQNTPGKRQKVGKIYEWLIFEIFIYKKRGNKDGR